MKCEITELPILQAHIAALNRSTWNKKLGATKLKKD